MMINDGFWFPFNECNAGKTMRHIDGTPLKFVNMHKGKVVCRDADGNYIEHSPESLELYSACLTFLPDDWYEPGGSAERWYWREMKKIMEALPIFRALKPVLEAEKEEAKP